VASCTFIKRFDQGAIICGAHAGNAPFFYPPDLEQPMHTILISRKCKIKIQPWIVKLLGMYMNYGDGWTTVDQQTYLLSVINQFQEDYQVKY
jgi:hypothetical protein